MHDAQSQVQENFRQYTVYECHEGDLGAGEMAHWVEHMQGPGTPRIVVSGRQVWWWPVCDISTHVSLEQADQLA